MYTNTKIKFSTQIYQKLYFFNSIFGAKTKIYAHTEKLCNKCV